MIAAELFGLPGKAMIIPEKKYSSARCTPYGSHVVLLEWTV